MAHRYPNPGPRDIARQSRTALGDAGRVSSRGGFRSPAVGICARFVLHARSLSPAGYHGNVAVTLAFPDLPVAPGDHLDVRGWLSTPRSAAGNQTFDELNYWASQNVYALFKVWSPDSVVGYTPVSRWHPLAWTWTLRQKFCAFWQRVLPEEEADLMIGLTIGGRGILTPAFKAQCIRAGVYHIVVISGQNVSVVIALGLALFQWVRWPRHKIWALAIPPILFYAQLTGADPPVLRAAFMAIYTLLSTGLRRDPPRLYSLSITVGIFLLFWPQAVFGASFQLSFAATVALMLGFALIPEGDLAPSNRGDGFATRLPPASSCIWASGRSLCFIFIRFPGRIYRAVYRLSAGDRRDGRRAVRGLFRRGACRRSIPGLGHRQAHPDALASDHRAASRGWRMGLMRRCICLH